MAIFRANLTHLVVPQCSGSFLWSVQTSYKYHVWKLTNAHTADLLFFQSVQVKQRRWYMSGMGLLAIWIQWCPDFLKWKITRLVDTHLLVTKGNEVRQTSKVPRFTLQSQWPFKASLFYEAQMGTEVFLHVEHYTSTFLLPNTLYFFLCMYIYKYRYLLDIYTCMLMW